MTRDPSPAKARGLSLETNMSETKHTPGPWEARTFLVMGGRGKRDRICHVGTSTSLGPSRSDETVANACLVAAAPDLLAALIAIEARHDEEDRAEAEGDFTTAWLALREQARAAIAKATGASA